MKGNTALILGTLGLIAGVVTFSVELGFLLLLLAVLTLLLQYFALRVGTRAWREKQVTGLVGIVFGEIGFILAIVRSFLSFFNS